MTADLGVGAKHAQHGALEARGRGQLLLARRRQALGSLGTLGSAVAALLRQHVRYGL